MYIYNSDAAANAATDAAAGVRVRTFLYIYICIYI